MYKHHLASNHQRNQKQATDSSSLPPQNDTGHPAILSEAKNLSLIDNCQICVNLCNLW